MRFPFRSIATLTLAVGVATCSDTPIATVRSGASPATRVGFGRLAFQPQFSRSAAAIYEQLVAQGVNYDNVRVAIRDPLDTTKIVKDTIVSFTPNQDSLPVNLDVPVTTDGQRFDAGLDYRNGPQTLFSGHVVVQSYRPGDTPPPAPPVPLNYTGPGANAAHLTISPRNVTLSALGSITFSATATDASNNPVTTPPVTWGVSDATMASITSDGVLTGKGRRGFVNVSARFGTSISDLVTATFTLPAARIAVVSGAGQSGKVGATLPTPAVVQVSAVDGVGVPGVPVVFSAPAGGAVTPTTATTDANGRASATLKLGSAIGPQGFAATAAGFSVGITETATAGDASAISIVSGGTQTDTVRKTLAPLVVKAADAFGNPVSGVTVTWAKTSGGGSLGATTSITGADGEASNSYTLGSTAGQESVTATLNGVAGASAAFSFTAVAGSAASIVIVSGNAQTGKVNQDLATPLVVRVADAANNPVSGATVTWTATNGTIPASSATDATGQASATLTGGLLLGPAGATASIAGHSVTFSATLEAGTVTRLAFRAQPANGTANTTMNSVTVALLDAGGNVANATNAVTLALGNNPNGATLGGTLTRNAVNGVATFNDLKLDKTGNGYTLVASSASLTPVTSSAFAMATGNASALTIFAGNGQSATVNTAVTTAPAVRVVDAANNPIPGVSVTFTPASGSGSVAPASGVVTTNAQGVAALTSWTLGITAGAQSLVVSSTDLSPVTIGATATPGNAYKLTITNKGALQTAIVSGATMAPQPVVQLVDQFGNAVPAGTMQVIAAATASSATVGGTTQMAAGATTGTATFTNLSVSGSGSTRIEFREASGGIKPDTSASLSISAASASQLIIVPSNTDTLVAVTAGASVTSPQLKVADASGNAVSGATVHFAIDSGSATTTAVSSNDYTSDASGLVTLGGRLPTRVGVYHLTASLASVSGASRRFTIVITPGTATQLAFLQPTASPRVTTRAGATIPVSVALLDQYGNIATSAPATSITVALNVPSGTSNVTFGGTKTVNTTSGIAAFTDLTVDRAAIGYTLSASATSYTSVTSPAFDVPAANASKLAFVPMPAAATVGQNLSVTVQLQDSFGNYVPTSGTSVTLAKASGSGTITTNSPVQSANGSAVFSVGFPAAGTYTLSATADGLTTATTGDITVSPSSNPTALKFDPVFSGALGAARSIKVFVVDGSNNTVASAAGTITLSLSGGDATAALSSSSGLTQNIVNGVATFSNLNIDKLGNGYAYIATPSVTGFTVPAKTSGTFDIVNFSIVAGLDQSSGPAGGFSSIRPSITATRVDNTAAPNVPVQFAAVSPADARVGTSTSGSFGSTISPSTNVSGNANAVFQLSATPGANTFRITVGGKATTVTIYGTGTATTMTATAGGGQSAAVGTAVATAPRVRVTDGSGNGVAGVSVTFTVTAGGGTIASSDNPESPVQTVDVTTDATGYASLGNWTLGTTAGANTLTAALTSNPAVSTSFSATGTSTSAINLVLDPTTPTSFTYTAGTPPTTLPKIKAVNSFGTTVAGAYPIHIQVTTNNTSVGVKDTTTDADGTIKPPASLLPNKAGTYVVTATSSAIANASATLSLTVNAAAASKLTITTPSTVTAGTGFSVNVSVTDAYDNVIIAPTGSVGLTLTPPSGVSASLGGATSASSQSGTVAFSGLTITKAAIGYTITAAASGLTSATTSAFNVSAGGAAKYLVTATTTTPATGSTNTTVTATLADAYDNAMQTQTPRAVNWTVTGAGSVSPSSSNTNNLGQATTTYTAPSTTGTNGTVVATDATTSSITGSIVLTPTSTVSGINITGAPSGESTVSTTLSPITIQFYDNAENTLTSVPGSVTVELLSGGAAATGLSGTSTRAVSNGTAVFSDLAIGNAGIYQLKFTYNGVTRSTSSFTIGNPLTITANTATSQTGAAGGTVTGPSVHVTQNGEPKQGVTIRFDLASSSGTYLIAAGNEGNSVDRVTDASGNASVQGWILPATAGTYTTSLSVRNFAGAPTPPQFSATVVAGVYSLAFVDGHGQPGTIRNDSSFSSGPQIIALDASNNPVSNVVIDATIENPPASSLAPPGPALSSAWMFGLPNFYANGHEVSSISDTTKANGIADFSGARLRGLVQSFRVRFTARGTSISLAATSQLRHGAAAQAVCSASLPSVVGLSHRLSVAPKLHVTDVSGNDVTSELVTLEASGGSLENAGGSTDANGDISASAWTTRSSAGTDSVRIHGATGACTVKTSSPSSIKITRHSNGEAISVLSGLKNGDAIPDLDATVIDANGLALEDTTFGITANAITIRDKMINIHSSKSSDSHGKSAFTGLSVDAIAQGGAKFQFTLDNLNSISGLVTFDSIDVGSATQIDVSPNASSTIHVSSGVNLAAGAAEIAIKDHNRRNGVSAGNISVTWKLDGTCTGLSFGLANQVLSAISVTGNNGRATSPLIYVGTPALSGCSLIADAGTTYGTTTFSIVSP